MRKFTLEEESILMELGANIILSEQPDEKLLIFSIQNIISWLNEVEVEKEELKNVEEEKIFLNSCNRSFMIYDEEIILTKVEYLLISKLLDSKNQVVPYEKLIEETNFSKDREGHIQIANIIFHIRKKIEQNKVVKIENIRSAGYRLVIEE